MEQNPIFIPLDEIAGIDYPETTPYRSGQVEIKPKGRQLNGYRDDCLTVEYSWDANGPGKGFSQTLACQYGARSSHFNHLMRTLENFQSNFVILLPKGDFYTVVGRYFDDINVATECVRDQSFMLTCNYAPAPFPFYDGPVNIHDCDVAELTDVLFGTRGKEDGV